MVLSFLEIERGLALDPAARGRSSLWLWIGEGGRVRVSAQGTEHSGDLGCLRSLLAPSLANRLNEQAPNHDLVVGVVRSTSNRAILVCSLTSATVSPSCSYKGSPRTCECAGTRQARHTRVGRRRSASRSGPWSGDRRSSRRPGALVARGAPRSFVSPRSSKMSAILP